MKANSEKTKQSKKATRRVLAGVLCGASVLSLVLSLVMPPISQAIANDAQTDSTEETVMGGGSSSESTGVENANNGDTENQNSDETESGESNTIATEADQPSDDAGVGDAAKSADDSNNDESAIALASVDDNSYTEIAGNVASSFTDGGKFRLNGPAYSEAQIKIAKDTTIDLAGHMLCHGPGSVESFIVVQNNATLTIEDSGRVVDDPKPFTGEPGQPATMTWTGNNNGTPQSLTYYETTSTPNEDKLGTTETTTEHTVSGFGAIVAASKSGSVKQVISVADGSTLNLNGGMITTPRPLGDNGHVILSQGAVNISGGYVTNGSGGGWGGGLCVTGANASLVMTGGVIAGNQAASGGGIFANNGAVLKLFGGVISGNATYVKDIFDGYSVNAGGYGGGVYTQSATVTISDSANITNNRAEARLANKELYNKGLLGGGGIASHGGTLSMTGGSVTANYSYEAGGGIYAGLPGQGVGFTMSSGFIAGNMSDNAEGGGLRISGDTTGDINAENASNRVYITNNKTMTGSKEDRGGDWGGGGVFVQKGGKLNIVKTLITNNKAGGWGGGIGACPTGETIVSHSNGAAIYDNTDNVDQDGKKLPDVDQNEHKHPAYHYSAGGDNKTEDRDEVNYVTHLFQNSGHEDFFLVRNKTGADKTIAVVLGKMLGGGSADWKGTCDGKEIKIDANGGAEAKWMFGLEAHPNGEAVKKAQAEATTVISGNYSYTHGGGIMTNGDLIVGKVTSLDVYPAIKVKANKVFMKDGKAQSLAGHGYRFKLLGKAAGTGEEPYWDTNGKLQANGCEATSEFTVNTEEKMGEIVIDTAANYQSSDYDLYLVEVPIEEKGTKFDKSIYKIHVDVSDQPVEETDLLGIKIRRHAVNTSTSKVYVKKEGETVFKECDKPADFYKWSVDSADRAVSTVTIGNDSNPAFTNVPYQTVGSWTPQVTKKVDGGEMKKFKFELYTKNSDTEKSFKPIYKCTTAGSKNLQIVDFGSVQIGPLGVNELDNNRQAQFTYYICECAASEDDGTKHEGYKNDTKTFKVVVTAKDDGNGHLNCTPVYYEVDANGHENKTPTDTPTFTNTYSTSLPLSGMSGVTLTYLAGAAVLCAAAAWMHIRRKANAKGGERRE